MHHCIVYRHYKTYTTSYLLRSFCNIQQMNKMKMNRTERNRNWKLSFNSVIIYECIVFINRVISQMNSFCSYGRYLIWHDSVRARYIVVPSNWIYFKLQTKHYYNTASTLYNLNKIYNFFFVLYFNRSFFLCFCRNNYKMIYVYPRAMFYNTVDFCCCAASIWYLCANKKQINLIKSWA